ncbi:MAG: hypothetical protein M3N30_13185 [Bacteroidota bacterium]|nr:hypothetical protein [Bacteroidota bacterium]
MKNILAIFLFVVSLSSCENGNGDERMKTDSISSAIADSAKITLDSTAAKVDSAIHAGADTIKSKIEGFRDSVKKALRK